MLAATLLALLLLNPPLIEILGLYNDKLLFGWPLQLAYIYLVWGALILLVLMPVGRRRRRRRSGTDGRHG